MFDEDFSKAQAAVLNRYDLVAEERWIDASIVEGQAHVLVAGEGPPVVLLNGIGVPAAMWAPLMARLDGVTQYAVDLPGYGLTDTTPGFANDLRTNAVRFLTEVLDSLGLDQPVVVANSLGSLWASWLAMDHPDRVAALAHIGCPAIVFDTSAPLPMRLLSARPLGRLMMKLQPPSERQVDQLATMVNEHPLPPEIARLILTTERLSHFEDTFLAMLNRLLRLRGNRPDLALTADHLARIQAPYAARVRQRRPHGLHTHRPAHGRCHGRRRTPHRRRWPRPMAPPRRPDRPAAQNVPSADQPLSWHLVRSPTMGRTTPQTPLSADRSSAPARTTPPLSVFTSERVCSAQSCRSARISVHRALSPGICDLGWLEVSCWVLVQVVGQSILDDVESLLAEAGYAVEHFLDGVGAVAFPGVEFFDDSEWVAGSVGLGDIAGEPLVGDVGVVLERACGLDQVDVPSLVGSR